MRITVEVPYYCCRVYEAVGLSPCQQVAEAILRHHGMGLCPHTVFKLPLCGTERKIVFASKALAFASEALTVISAVSVCRTGQPSALATEHSFCCFPGP